MYALICNLMLVVMIQFIDEIRYVIRQKKTYARTIASSDKKRQTKIIFFLISCLYQIVISLQEPFNVILNLPASIKQVLTDVIISSSGEKSRVPIHCDSIKKNLENSYKCLRMI